MPTKAELLQNAVQLRDTPRLKRSIRKRYNRAYKGTVTALLRERDCTQSGRDPSGEHRQAIDALVDRDIESILNTFNRERDNQIARQLQGFPDASLDDHRDMIREWMTTRDAYKDRQIAHASRTNAAEYARSQFYQNNKLVEKLFIWDASPPIVFNSHRECVNRVGQGAVPFDTAQGWSKTHPNCRHQVKEQVPSKINCKEAWRG